VFPPPAFGRFPLRSFFSFGWSGSVGSSPPRAPRRFSVLGFTTCTSRYFSLCEPASLIRRIFVFFPTPFSFQPLPFGFRMAGRALKPLRPVAWFLPPFPISNFPRFPSRPSRPNGLSLVPSRFFSHPLFHGCSIKTYAPHVPLLQSL